MTDREWMIYDSLTDDDLRTPVADLPAGKVAVIEHVLKGPHADDLIERIERVEGTP